MYASIIVTYRDDPAHPARRTNLLALARSLEQTTSLPLTVVEQDSYPRLTSPLPNLRAKVVFAFNPGPFNKSWGLNVGARIDNANVFVFGDADLIVGQDILKAVEYCQKGFMLVKPYKRLLDLSAEESVAWCRQDLMREEQVNGRPFGRAAVGERLALCGGSFAMRADAFWSLGGWDERFLGWGGEDDAMSYKVERRRLSAIELDENVALHLWHPRNLQTTRGHPDYQKNLQLLASYSAMDGRTFARFCEVQRQLAGNHEKYRPFDST